MSKASQVLSYVRRVLDSKDWRYELIEGKDALMMRGLPLDCKLKEFNCTIFTTEYFCTSYAFISLNADKDCRMAVAEYLMRANYGLKSGKFEMDFSDGEIKFALSIDMEDRIGLSESLILQTLLGTGYRMINRYGDGLIAVMYGIKSPEDAIREAESQE